MECTNLSRRQCIGLVLSASFLAGIRRVSALSLNDLQGSRRVIVAFGETGDALLEQFLESTRKHACEIKDRDLDIYLVTSQGVDSLTEEAMALDEESGKYLLSLRHSTDSGLALVLIGKDGGVKGRADTANGLTDFFTLIDGMPMRQRELEEQGESC